MSTQHTPGPWLADLEVYPVMVRSQSETWPLVDEIGNEEGRAGAFVCNTGDNKANARLIAAAPDLLEACQTFAEWLRREEEGFDHKTHNRETPEGEAAWKEWFWGNVSLIGLAQDQVRAAIAKAAGSVI
jgi:hypothetical protein